VQFHTGKLLDAQFASDLQAVTVVDLRLRIVLLQPRNFAEAVE
jgi:hypothetical protein